MSIVSARISPIHALIALALAAAVGLGQGAHAATAPEASWQPRQPGYIVETVAGGLRLPVDIALVPHAGTAPDSPWLYVTELYGSVKVVTRDGTVTDYATGLLNYAPSSSFPGAGEVGLAGIVVEPVTGDVIVSLAYQDGGALHPEVLRLHSADGGLTASSTSVLLSMPALTLTTSHMASNLSIGPDGKLYVHVGDAGIPAFSQNPDSFGGKILRMELDGRPATDNPGFSAADGITARDYVYASGLRNPFGGDWRSADGHHYAVENGPGVDRFARILSGGNLGYDGTDLSMATGASYLWSPAHAPVNLAFVQASVFSGSGFPAEKRDHAFVSEFGSYWASGPSVSGKRISEFVLDADGHLASGPVPLIEFTGAGKATAVGLAAGQDGLYFTDLFADAGNRFDDTGAHVLRVRYVGTVASVPATITVIADPAVARERHLRPGALIVSRTGDTSVALPVAYTVGGTAQPGVEYQPLSGLVVIPAGASSASVDVMPIQDTIAYGDQTVVVTLTAGSASAVGTPSSATVLLRDDDRVTRATIAIDQATRFQTISGIGGNFANGRFTGSPQVNDAVGVATLAKLAPTHARVGIPLKGWAPASITPSSPDLGYVDAGDVHNVFLLLQDLQRRGIPIVASVWDAPDWMVADATKSTARTLASGMEAPFVAALTSFLSHAHDLYGIDIQAVSLNEADSGFNLLVPASQASSLAVQAVQGFRARGLIAGWIVGDATGITADYPYAVPTLDDPQARPLLVALGLHTWDAELRPDAAFAGVAALASSHGLPVWATEIGYDSQVYHTNPGTFSTWDNAWRLALVTQRTVTVGRASVLDFWSYQNDYPLADPATGRLYPAGVVVKQLSDRLQPGMRLVAATPDVPVLQAFAAVDDGRNAFMAQLTNISARPARVVVTGLPDRDLALVRTSRFERIADLGSRRAHGGRLTITLPGQSISSLSGDLHAGRADQPPVVDAGPDQNLSATLPIQLHGTVHDDGRPAGSTLTIAWTVDSGPGPVQFANPAAAATTATISVAGEYRLRLTASDGQLSASASVLISAIGADLHVNFQPTNAAVPAGYVPDSGKVFADRGNGFQYGWVKANSTAFIRSSQASPDQRYDTGIAAAAAARWEIVVPNGDYMVHLVAGDATNGSANEQFLAEGNPVLSGVLSATRHWVESTTRVTVGDGRLTVGPALGAVATSLAFVDIVPVPVTPPEVTFSAIAGSIPENSSSSTVLSVDLSHAYPLPVTVAYQVAGGSAIAGTNVVVVAAGSLTFPAGTTHQGIPIQPLDDHVYGHDTTLVVSLSSPSNAVLGSNASTTLTITDSDPVPTIAFVQASVQAPETAGTITLTLNLTAVSALPISVAYAVTAGSAQAGVNYLPLAGGQLTIQPGSLTGSIPVALLDDHIHNPDQTLVLSLSQPAGAVLGGTSSEVVTITDADPLPVLNFSQTSVTVDQSAGTFTLPVALGGASGIPVTATILPTGGSAVAGTDYLLPSGAVLIAPGATESSVQVAIRASGAVDDRTVTLQLSGLAGASAGPQQTFVLTIRGIGQPTVVSFGAAAGQGDDAVTSVSVQVILQQPSPTPLVVPYHVSGGTAINGPPSDPTSDFFLPDGTVTIPAGETSANLTFSVVNRSIPELTKSLIVQLDQADGITLGDQATFTYQITNDDLPVPVVQFAQGTSASAGAFGAVPVGYGITHVIVTAAGSFSDVTGTVDSDSFAAHVGNTVPAVPSTTVSIAFSDDAGHVGPSASLDIPFGQGSGIPYVTGDPADLPPDVPTIKLGFTSGLTGDQTGRMGNDTVFFTNNSAGKVVIGVNATAEVGTIMSVQVDDGQGTTYDGISGTVTLPVLPEGRYEFTATAVSVNGDKAAFGMTSTSLILIVDTTPPVLTFLVPQRYWPHDQNLDPANNPNLIIPLRSSLTNDRDLVLLNGNSDGDNIPLRDLQHMNVFDVAGFTAEASVTESSGIDSDASRPLGGDKPAATALPSSASLSLQSPVSPESGSPQTIVISGLVGLADSIVYDPTYLTPTSTPGRYTLHVHLQDRAGNSLDSDQFKIWVKRKPPVALVGAYKPDSYGGDFANAMGYFGATVEISPSRWIVSTPDTVEVWQDSVGDGNLLPRMLPGSDDPSLSSYLVPTLSAWRLRKPQPIPPGGSGSVSVITQDFLGNKSGIMTRTMSRTVPDVRYDGPPEGNGGKDVLFGGGGGYGNDANVTERPIYGTTWSFGSDAFRFTIGKAFTTIPQAELSLLGTGNSFKEGIRDAFRLYTVDPNDYWNGAVVTGVDLTDANTTSGVVHYTGLLVNPIDPGTDEQRLAGPAIVNIPPSWQRTPSSVQVRVHDQGVAALAAASSPNLTFSIESLHPGAHVSLPSMGPVLVTAATGKAMEAHMQVSRSSVDPTVAQPSSGPSVMVNATDPGLARIIYAITAFNGQKYATYSSRAGFQWMNFIRISPDVVNTGSRITVRIEAGFLDATLTPTTFKADGDYVHFIANGKDITQSVSEYDPTADPVSRSGLIAIAAQRLVVEGSNSAHVQTLELDLDVADDAPVALCDVEIKCGGVKAFPDELSKAFASDSGAHRMPQSFALASFKVKDIEIGQMQFTRIEDFITFEAPAPIASQIQQTMSTWKLVWTSKPHAYVFKDDPSGFTDIGASITPVMKTATKGGFDVVALGGDVVQEEVDTIPIDYTSQFYVDATSLGPILGLTGIVGNIIVHPATPQLAPGYDDSLGFIKAPAGLTSLMGRPGSVTFRDIADGVDLTPAAKRFVMSADPSTVSDSGLQCATFGSWNGTSGFTVNGVYPGTTVFQIHPVINGATSPDVVCNVAIPVELPLVNEPSILHLDSAKTHTQARGTNADENFVESPTPLATAMPDPKSVDFPYGTIHEPTVGIEHLDALYEASMFVAGQILPVNGNGWHWYDPFDTSEWPTARFNFGTGPNDFELTRDTIVSLLTDGKSTNQGFVAEKLQQSPPYDIWRRYAASTQNSSVPAARDQSNPLWREMRGLELHAKSLLSLAATCRLERYFSITIDSKASERFWLIPNKVPLNRLAMVGDDLGGLIAIPNDQDMRNAIFNFLGDTGLPQLFKGAPTGDSWDFGNPITEQLISYMLAERSDLCDAVRKDIGINWSKHFKIQWDGAVPDALANATIHIEPDADGFLELVMYGPAGARLGWSYCVEQTGFTWTLVPFQGQNYSFRTISGLTGEAQAFMFAQDEKYRLILAYNAKKYAEFWSFAARNYTFSMIPYMIGDAIAPLTDLYQLGTGRNLATGEDLTREEAIISSAMVILAVIPADMLVIKGFNKVVRGGVRGVSSVFNAVKSNVSRKAAGSELETAVKDIAEDGNRLSVTSAENGPFKSPTAYGVDGSTIVRRPEGFVSLGWQGMKSFFRTDVSLSDLMKFHLGCGRFLEHLLVEKGALAAEAGLFRPLAVNGKRVLQSAASQRFLPRNAHELLDNFVRAQQFMESTIAIFGKEEGLARLERLRSIACFVAATPVAMADGTWKKIGDIHVGDEVLTKDQFSRDSLAVSGRVTEIFRHSADQLRNITLRDSAGSHSIAVRTTDGHPFWRIGEGWVPAIELGAGDRIGGQSGDWVVTGIELDSSARVDVYNLQIDGGHTYFVGGDSQHEGIWVHNFCRAFDVMYRALVRNQSGMLPATKDAYQLVFDTFEKLAKGEAMFIPGVFLPGDSAKLRTALIAFYGHPAWVLSGNAAAHHLISTEVAGSAGIKDFFKRVGFDVNRFCNGIFLPTAKDVAGAGSLTVHGIGGNHPGYRDAQTKFLTKVIGMIGQPGKGDAWAIGVVRQMQLAMRKNLRKGVPLDLANDPSGRKVAAIWAPIFDAIVP